jgi:hypothetical protein
MNDESIRLVDAFDELQRAKKEIDEKIEKSREQIILLAKQKNTDILFGTNKKCSIKEFEKVVYPEDKTLLINLINSKGLYNELSSINYFKLSPRILKNQINQDIIDLTKKEKSFLVVLKEK